MAENSWGLEDLLEVLREKAGENQRVFLVGGSVRDILLGRAVHDFDFSVDHDAARLARKVANHLQGAFFMLDGERDTARVILNPPGSEPIVVDFTGFRGDSLDEDLLKRDFTVNAIAVDIVDPQKAIDPLGGKEDLHQGVLRACSPTSFIDDPLRVLRGVRLALGHQLRIVPETLALMRQAAPLLDRVSEERQRDELFKILEGPRASAGIRLMDQLGVLAVLLPEVAGLNGFQQSAPHVYDVYNHTLATMKSLEELLSVLVGEYREEANNLITGLAVLRLGRFRQQLAEHFSRPVTNGRSLRGLLFLAALLHDSAKPESAQVDETGRIRFFNHDVAGAERAANIARRLVFSQAEINWVETVVRNHMRVHFLAKTGQPVSRKAVYHYFRATGDAGVDVCILSLADVMATYGVTLSSEHWQAELDVCRDLLEAWWEKPSEAVRPPRLLTGEDLKLIFNLEPGPLIGKLLDAVQEAQATGEVTDRDGALKLVQEMVAKDRAVERRKDGEEL